MYKIVFLIILLKILHCTNSAYENQPKIISSDGNLVFEPAMDKNITFRLKGRGYVNINDVNIVHMMGSGGNVTVQPADAPSLLAFQTQLQSLYQTVRGPAGLIQRVRFLENNAAYNTSENTTRPRLRLFTLGQRITAIQRRVGGIETKLRKNNCDSNPCEHGGTCINQYESYFCLCPLNWEGRTCTEDVNECAELAGTDLGCQHGATCVNTPGDYSCVCAPGYFGMHCTQRTTDCLSSGGSDLCGPGTCVNKNNPTGYECICNQGWKSNGITPACTVDINECTESKPHCSKDPPVQCINLPGSFVCGNCPAGFTGNGYYCVDINECDINNGGCSTNPSVICINTRGSFHCGNCPLGYIGDGRTCTQNTGLCSTPEICHSLARCVEYQNTVACICPDGYSGGGMGPAGCTRMNNQLCTASSCQNGGTCTMVNATSFQCDCPPGTNPPYCSAIIDPCLSNPCLNSGTCTKTQNGRSYRCACTSNFIGRNCQRAGQDCGGVLKSESGTLKFPSAGSLSYQHNSRCAWLLRTNTSKVLNITFTKFLVEDSSECRFDWLQIHDGRSSASHLIGRFCGSEFPKGGNIISTQNALYFWFRSDNTTSHSGFEFTWESIDPICGGVIETTSHGTISSPGSPGPYPPNRDCEWTVRAPPGKRIQFLFFTMQIEAHVTCQYDYLEIYSGDTKDMLLERFCNTSHPKPLTTPSNEALLYFHSDGDSTDAGFQITYTVMEGIPGCGGIYTQNSGELKSPSQHVDGTYPHNLMCDFLIQLPANSKVQIKFLKFELEESGDCYFDYLEIYNGRTDLEDNLVGKFCGTNMPPKYTSTGNTLLIRFKSDFSTAMGGFVLNYDIACGGVFEEPTGVLMSPFYPQQYQSDHNCEFYIVAPLKKAITLHFIDVDFEESFSGECSYDSISVYDGHDANATLLGKYCDSVPNDIISSYNYLHLIFQSDQTIHGRGFKANYSFFDIPCGGIIKSPNTVITPPPDDDEERVYASDAFCKWVIIAPPGNVVQITWLTFDLEGSTDCQYDFVEVFDNSTTHSGKMGRYCGSTLPPAAMTIDNVMTVTFKSDVSSAKLGFSALITFIEGSKDRIPNIIIDWTIYEIQNGSMPVCGGNYFTSSGLIRSPGYPDNYYESMECEWVITAPTGQQIELTVHNFTMEDHQNCRFDFLELRNGGTVQAPLIGKYCGSKILNRFVSFGNKIYLKFVSDSSRSEKGFEIEWDSTATGCGGVVTSPRGSISSPNYPEPYGANAQCVWRISISEGSTLQMIFVELNLESHQTCTYDYVEIFDGRDPSGDKLGKFCTTEQLHPLQLETKSNHAFVRLTTDATHQERGFSLRYSFNCNRTIENQHNGIIESPNFPEAYPHNLNCEWRIKAPAGNKIRYEFSHFELENMGKVEGGKDICQFDYVELIQREGDESMGAKKYCNPTRDPILQTSVGDELIIRFVTDTSGAESGFRLEWEIEGCGGVLTHPTGTFSSPNYPLSYPDNTHCQWTIVADYGNIIQLIVEDFDFEKSGDCNYDGLMVSNIDNNGPLIGKYCHSSDKLSSLTSNTHQMFVKFFTDSSNAHRGFKARYQVVPAACGGVLSTPSGFLYSPQYPKNYASNQLCEWKIITDPSHTLNLGFMDFDLENSENCTHDSLTIYDGLTADTLLRKECGSQMPNITTLTSKQNELMVVFKTDPSVEAKGFKLNYTTSCGSKITTNSSGEISLSSAVTSNVQECAWTITADDPTKRVSLTVTELNLQRFSSELFCDCKLEIFDGIDSNGSLRENYCANKVPPTIVSNGNSLFIKFSTDMSYNLVHAHFKAYYSVFDNACGGRFNAEHGEFASPGYPNTYPNNVECLWVIEASPGNKISLSFQSIGIEESENCNADYLEIRHTDMSGKLLDVLCGSNPATTNLTIASKLWVKFRSDAEGTGAGFLASYKYIEDVELTGESGQIASPMYPNYLLNSMEHSYRVLVSVGSVISIDFKVFQMCHTRFEIFDGYDNTAPLIDDGPSCDSAQKDPLMTSTNVVYIKVFTFMSEGQKFLLEWKEVGKPVNSTNEANSTCGPTDIKVVYGAAPKTIQSPGYPKGYGDNVECEWIIESSNQSHHPVLIFNDIDLEATDNCLSDYVEVFLSKDRVKWHSAGRLCTFDIHRKNVYHGEPYLQVKFKSDFYQNRTGFGAMVYAACGGEMRGPNGMIDITYQARPILTSYSLPVCVYNITVGGGKTIQFEFESMNITYKPTTTECNGYIIIKNGIDEDAPILGQGKYCGSPSDMPKIPETTSNRAFVQYFSYFRDTFRLKYKEVSVQCGGRTVLSEDDNNTVISSPNYPNIPTPQNECLWTITARNGERLRVDFLERFDLTTTANCEKEYVEIRDGGTSLSRPIGVFCGQMPQSQYSKTNMLRIKYFTNTTTPKNGFKLRVSTTVCGGFYRGDRGVITSPNYPGIGAYPSNKECEYRIVGSVGSIINITFNAIDLPESNDCSTTDHITVYSVIPEVVTGNETVYELGKFCGSNAPSLLTSDSNQAIVKFKTFARKSEHSGFSLVYASSLVKCGGSIESDTGVVMSNGYPSVLLSKQYCEWKITAPRGKRIKIVIEDLDLVETSNMYTQRLGFYNNHMYSNRITFLRSLEGNTSRTIFSSSNKMLINLWVRTPSTNRGFKLTFTSEENALCIGDLNQLEGDIDSPRNTSAYFCEYYRENVPLSSEANKGTMALYFNGIMGNTRMPLNCRYFGSGTIVSRQTVSLESSSVLARLCSSLDSRTVVRSPFSDTKVEIKQSQIGGNLLNFTLHYKVHNCGGVLMINSTNVQQPVFADNYGKVDCAWSIEFPITNTITFQITQLDLKQPCDKEYLIVSNGPTPLSPFMKKICGNTIEPDDLRSSSNTLFIEYHSESYDKNSKFQFQTVPLQRGCGGVLNRWSKILKSPQTDGNQYPANAECMWEIRAESGYHIGLTFTGRFFIEESDNCTKDFVEIFDFKNDEWKSMGRVCGRNLPPVYNSTATKMKVLFRSDAIGSGDGFTIEWHQNCGGMYEVTSEKQMLASPNFPGFYGNMLTCNYTFVAPENKHMWINFLDFELETISKQCNYDNLTIYKQDDYGTELNKMGTYCKKDSLSKFRAKNRVSMIFRTDAWVQRRGFQLEYTLDICGGLITNSTLIKSPMTENAGPTYHAQMVCYWNITAPAGKKIVVRFEEIDIEQGYDCYFDFVRVYSGTEPKEPNRLASLCGRLTGHTPAISINNRHGLIHMQTDGSNNFKGFSALILIMDDCDKTINLTSTANINFLAERGYNNSLDCHYLIHTKPGNTIALRFEQFHVRCCPNLNDTKSCDYVEIRDGAGPFAEVMMRECGDSVPKSITSSGSSMYLRFVTDAVNASTGFVAQVNVEIGQCGPPILNMTGNTEVVLRPHLTRDNITDVRCSWLLTTAPNKMIEIEFDEMDLQPADEKGKCSKEKLTIADENQQQYVAEGLGENYVFRGKSQSPVNFYSGIRQPITHYEYCGTGRPNAYISSTSKVHISYAGTGYGNQMGFKLRAKTLNACARNYTSLTGRIMSYDATNCDILISVPDNNTIAIYFTAFMFYFCEENAGLQIYDGGKNGALLFTACGYSLPNPVFSTKNSLYLKSVTTKPDSYASIDITYVANDQERGCGGRLFNYGGTFTSPMYPFSNRTHSDCRWEVAVPQNLKVALRFNVFDMGSKITCNTDFIEIIETNISGAENVRKYCGEDSPEVYRASTNVVTVRFKKSVHFSGTGWIIHFMGVHEDTVLGNF